MASTSPLLPHQSPSTSCPVSVFLPTRKTSQHHFSSANEIVASFTESLPTIFNVQNNAKKQQQHLKTTGSTIHSKRFSSVKPNETDLSVEVSEDESECDEKMIEDSEDLCPVCVDNCTCQRKSESRSQRQEGRKQSLTTASKPKSPVKRSMLKTGSITANHANERDSAVDLCECIVSCSSSLAADRQLIASDSESANGIVISIQRPSTSIPHANYVSSSTNARRRFSVSISDGEDYMFSPTSADDNEDDEEDWDSEDDLYHRYDSVEYEYIVNDLLENEVISELAFTEDPIESLDILLFGSSGIEDEEMSIDDVSFELDLIPSQPQRIQKGNDEETVKSVSSSTPYVSMPVPISSVCSQTICNSQNAYERNAVLHEEETNSQPIPAAATAALSSATDHLSNRSQSAFSQPVHIAAIAASQSQFSANFHYFASSNNPPYNPASLSSSSISNHDDAYDSYCEEDNCWMFSTSPLDHSPADSGMLSIDDILDSAIYTTERQIHYRNEFLDRYKRIPISTFRRSRRKQPYHSSRQSRVNYKKYIKHDDWILGDVNLMRAVEIDLPIFNY